MDELSDRAQMWLEHPTTTHIAQRCNAVALELWRYAMTEQSGEGRDRAVYAAHMAAEGRTAIKHIIERARTGRSNGKPLPSYDELLERIWSYGGG